MILCELIINKEEELKRWEALRRGETYVGPLNLYVGNHAIHLTASYQPVKGVEVKGSHVFFSAAVVGESFEGCIFPVTMPDAVNLDTVDC